MPDPNPIANLYTAPPQPPQSILSNPLAAAQSIVGIQGQQLQLQQMRGAQAVGNVLQGSLNPDGTVNSAKYSTGIQGLDPRFGAAVPTAVQSGLNMTGSALQNHGLEVDNATKALNLGVANNRAAAEILAPYAGQNIPPEVRNNIRAKLAAAHVDPATAATADLSSAANAAAAAKIAAVQGMGPPAANAPVMGTPNAATGAPTVVPFRDTIGAGTRVVGLPPGADISAAAYEQAKLRESNYGQEMYPMQRALQLAHTLGPGGTGPGAEGRSNFASFINTLSPTIAQWLPGIDPQQIKDFAEFNKYVTQAAQARASGLGAHTDQQVATTLTANPSAHIDNLATEDVLKANIALRNMERVQNLEGSKSGPIGFTKATSGLAGQLDPRAFLLPNLSMEQRLNLSKSLTGTARENFNKSIDLAIKHGVIDPASLAPPSAAPAVAPVGGQ